MKAPRTPWTEAEMKTAISMRKAGNSLALVAIALDRSFKSVSSKVGNLTTSIHGQRTELRSIEPVRQHYASRAEFLTSTLMGDPPAGRSALDQRTAR